MYKAIADKRSISAHIFNDVFIEFEEKFYPNGRYDNAMCNFKKWMKVSAENRGHEVVALPVSKSETLIHGIRNIWVVNYLGSKYEITNKEA